MTEQPSHEDYPFAVAGWLRWTPEDGLKPAFPPDNFVHLGFSFHGASKRTIYVNGVRLPTWRYVPAWFCRLIWRWRCRRVRKAQQFCGLPTGP